MLSENSSLKRQTRSDSGPRVSTKSNRFQFPSVPVRVLPFTFLVKESVGRMHVKKSQTALQGGALALAIPEVPSYPR